METSANEDRGFRVRVEYPILREYRYAVYPNAQAWRVADRPVATIFKTEDEATEAMQTINEDSDIKAVRGLATIEPIQSFDPDWCMPPGVHIQEQMKLRGLSAADLQQQLGLTPERFQVLLDGGDEYISSELAAKLEAATTAPAQYWYNLENNYREGIRKGLKVTR
jgi:plasmid maintenance system antidote protein VapI